MTSRIRARLLFAGLSLGLSGLVVVLPAQSRIKEMPGYARYQKMLPLIRSAVVSGEIRPDWADDSKSFTYTYNDKHYRYDVASQTATEYQAEDNGPDRGFFRRGLGRGRQFTEAFPPDSSIRAFYRDRNVWISNPDSSNARQLTTEGSVEKRIKYGTASWVYGEELGQRTAMWWSPDARYLGYYRFDEGDVHDYYLQLNQTELYDSVGTEAYPKAGTPNPVVDIYVYDARNDKTVKLDVRDGQGFSPDVVGYYVYDIRWTEDGSEILLNRTNRRQNIMELAACSPSTGACRVVVHEEWLPSWVENSPTIEWLKDGKRFIWESSRTGFANYYLHDLSGKLLATLTKHPFDVGRIVRVDEDAGELWYYARSGDNFMKMQLHKVGLDGKGDQRVTDPAWNNTVSMSPDGRTIVDIRETHDSPPVALLLNDQGGVLDTIVTSDISEARKLGIKPVEMFTYTSADGHTQLNGMIHFPSNFDPSHKYPVLFSVYGGPNTNGASERYTLPNPYTEFGFLVVTVDARSASGRGKAFTDAIYEKLGQTEIDDMAAASRYLAQRPYVDGNRVGIYGTSYGGYSSAMALLRHPEAFAAASASSPVTSWYNYDTIYTERYMWTPEGNAEGYRLGDARTYADSLEGRLMLYYGTADDNVHPSNMMQLIQKLQQADKSFDVQVGPDRGHSGLNRFRMMEFFIQNLIIQPGHLTS